MVRAEFPRPRFHGRAISLVGTGVVLVIALITILSTIGSAFAKTDGGSIAIVRNGGPFDNNRIRGYLPSGSGLTWIGWFSKVHRYPAQQRFYTITSDNSRGDRSGVDVEQDPTSDGVEVGVEGTIYFNLDTGEQAMRQFDDRYGTRRFRGLDGEYRYAWEGDEGWSTFLDQIVRPVISNDLREQLGDFRCAELISSCALVQNSGSKAPRATGQSNNANIARVQQALNTSLQQDLDSTLGGHFITGIRVNLARLTLPPDVQAAVTRAQAAFAAVTEAQARVASARADAEANRVRQRGYAACPACARIDELKAIPPTITTFAPGSGFDITSK